MKATFIFSLSALLCSQDSVAAQYGLWKVKTTTDAMTDSTEVVANLNSQSLHSGVSYRKERASLIARCADGSLDVYVYTPWVLDSNDVYGSMSARVRFGEDSPYTVRGSRSTGYRSFFFGSASAFMTSLANHERDPVRIEVPVYDRADQVIEFSLRGSLAAMTDVASACGATLDIDIDGDGIRRGLDCNDNDSSIYPGAPETCGDGRDSNCNGNDDYDCDGDGIDSEDRGGGDCDDSNPDIYPAPYYLDSDGDGYGSSEEKGVSCDVPKGHVRDPGDCADMDPTTYPGAEEICDWLDNDCDSEVDEGLPVRTWYQDEDRDGFGDPEGRKRVFCSQPIGFSSDRTDCNDQRDDVHPGALEVCDKIDNDCDGSRRPCVSQRKRR